jgi:hypothetical protein
MKDEPEFVTVARMLNKKYKDIKKEYEEYQRGLKRKKKDKNGS